uniref:Aminotransferase class I/classII large domain-containing protein n=1 Tax=Bionectria ochroleuca TaxID=29856 RepID=A0A8H7K144_BIOOC
MSQIPETTSVSARGAQGVFNRDIWGPREKSMGNPWSQTNPEGTIILRLAENSLMHDEVSEFIKHQMSVLPVNHLTYSTGPRGSRRLRSTLAEFFKEEFGAREPMGVDNISITPGLASAIDSLSWAICDEGDAILIPQPLYNGFNFDLLNRSGVRIVGVPYTGIKGFSVLDDLFNAEVNQLAIEAALEKASRDGDDATLVSSLITVLPELIAATASRNFDCIRLNLQSTWSTFHFRRNLWKVDLSKSGNSGRHPFVSTLSLDLQGIIDQNRHHVLYGASKDFCANGLRLGVVCTRNKGIIGAISSISMFSWSPHLIQDMWAAMLEDRTWLKGFLETKLMLMKENYQIATSFCRDHGIPFYEANAGLFLWLDLRHLLLLHATSKGDGDNVLATKPPNAKVLQERENEIIDLCLRNGVMIAPGHVYMPEEHGWFRMTFTVKEDALQEGLARLSRSLQEAGAQTASHSI